jgi:hypothetical protein
MRQTTYGPDSKLDTKYGRDSTLYRLRMYVILNEALRMDVILNEALRMDVILHYTKYVCT